MSAEVITVFVLLVAAVVLFATERMPVDLVALLLMSVLLLSGIVTPAEGVAGFSNVATVTVGAMFVLSAGLFKTGAVNFVGGALTRLGRRNLWLALLSIMVGVGAVSAFINNTAAVAIFLPVMLGLAQSLHVSPSKLLMPLSFASMLGGVCTLIGTSTNIVVSSIAERHGQPPFRMFEFLPLGLAVFGCGVLYMLAVGVRLIPARRTGEDLTQNFRMDEYLTDVVLLPESRSVGTPLGGSRLPDGKDPVGREGLVRGQPRDRARPRRGRGRGRRLLARPPRLRAGHGPHLRRSRPAICIAALRSHNGRQQPRRSEADVTAAGVTGKPNSGRVRSVPCVVCPRSIASGQHRRCPS